MSNGVHIAGVRSKDANGAWSHDNKWLFAKLGSTGSEGPLPAIARVEYYVNTDPGYGNGTPVTTTGTTTDASGSFTLNIAGFATGVTIVGVRTKDANGAWSHDNKWLFAKVPADNTPPNLARLEYYLDTDPGYGRAIPVAINPVNNLTAMINANITGLSTGKHKIYYRSRDANGAWSHDNVDSFTISPYNSAPAIVVNSATAPTTLCARDSFSIGYQATGTYAANNVFNAELSNADGSFPTTPVIIGSVSGNAAGGIIKCSLPAHSPEGTAYKVRVSSTSNVVTGIAGLAMLTIHDRPYAQTITGLNQVNGTYTWPYTVPTATGSSWSWLVTSGTQSSGGNTNSTTITWAQPATPSVAGKINVIETNQYGCVGDTSTLSLTIYKLRIGNTIATSACKGFGVTIGVNADGAYYAGNTYTAQLSDASGSFASPTVIGSTTLVGNGVGQTASITAIIPQGISNGTGYKVRIVSSIPAFTGDMSAAISIIKPDVGADITRSKCPGFGYNLQQDYTDAALTYTYFTQAFGVLPNPANVDAGTYQVIGTNSIGCADTATITITNYPKPDIGPDKTISKCPGETVDLTSLYTTTGLAVSWNTTTPSAQLVPGIYRLIVTNSNGCMDTAFATVSNYLKPDLGADKTVSKCAVDAVDLTTFFNTTGLNTNWNVSNPSAVYTPGTYQLIVTNSNGCKDTALVVVSNYPKPDLGPDKTVTTACTGGTYDLTMVFTTTGLITTWSTSTPTTATVGIYQLIVTNNNGCKDTASVTVNNTPITDVPTVANTKLANRECTTADGWTHYYYDNGTPADNSDDIRLLSLKKNGQNIGTIGDGTFQVKVAATTGAGSNAAVSVSNPLLASTFWSMNRYWSVTSTQQPVANVGVRFYYNTQDLTDVNGSYPMGPVNHSQLVLYKTDGNPDPTTNWAGATQARLYMNGVVPTTSSWVYTGLGNGIHQAEFEVTSFSGGGAGATQGGTLPISLLRFAATGKDYTAYLNWATSSETNSLRFLVARSLDGSHFTPVGSVNAAGQSTTTRTYSFTDDLSRILNGPATVYYRLLMLDYNYDQKASPIVTVKLGDAKAALSLLYNPVQSEAVLHYQSLRTESVAIRLIDATGRTVVQLNKAAITGDNQYRLPTATLAKGIYKIVLTGSGQPLTLSVMKE